MIRRRLSSYADVFGLDREHEPGEPIRPGDLVRTGPNRLPRYRVVAVHEDMAWIRGEASGRDHVVALKRLRKVSEDAGGTPPSGGVVGG